jgi:hypothetical protein
MKIATFIFALMFATLAHAAERDWFSLVTNLSAQQQRLDKDDQRFLRMMINVLTVDEHVEPNLLQQHWLLDIERRLAAGQQR